jgi:hypothetical protein
MNGPRPVYGGARCRSRGNALVWLSIPFQIERWMAFGYDWTDGVWLDGWHTVDGSIIWLGRRPCWWHWQKALQTVQRTVTFGHRAKCKSTKTRPSISFSTSLHFHWNPTPNSMVSMLYIVYRSNQCWPGECLALSYPFHWKIPDF